MIINFSAIKINANHISVLNNTNNTITVYNNEQFLLLLQNNYVLVCNKHNFTTTANNNLLDILELIIMLYGNINCYPSLNKLAEFFNITHKQQEHLLFLLLNNTIDTFNNISLAEKTIVFSLSKFLQQHKWNWSAFIIEHLAKFNLEIKDYYNLWKYIKKNKKNSSVNIDNNTKAATITHNEINNIFTKITANFNEIRPEQIDYTNFIAQAFTTNNDQLQVAIAKAGTGVGKTFGYLANAIAFINKNPNQQILISTFTKNLQKQIFNSLQDIFSNNLDQIALVKGNNNYLCLLNYQNLISSSTNSNEVIMLVLLSRLLIITQNGDLVGGELSSLANVVITSKIIKSLLNKKEECLYNKCKHFDNCFIIKAKNKAKNANILVSNHHFTILNNALGVKHIIWDEAHHLFDVADKVFSISFDINSILELQYWVCGTSNIKHSSKLNGLQARLKSIFNNTEQLTEINDLILEYVQTLSKHFKTIINEKSLHNVLHYTPITLLEEFFYNIHLLVTENNKDYEQYYNLETDATNIVIVKEDFLNCIGKVTATLENMLKISNKILQLLDSSLIIEQNIALEDFIAVFKSKLINSLEKYLLLLQEINNYNNKEYIYQFIINKKEANTINISYTKNYIDPSKAISLNVFSKLSTCVFTSATMLSGNTVDIFGLSYLPDNSFNLLQFEVESPFNYTDCSKIIIVNDIKTGDTYNLSYSLNTIFNSAGGGGLAIFTSIKRLKETYNNLKQISNLTIIAQHFNDQQVVNLIDEFKNDVNSCMLGTDSTRDGIDIPGNSLRVVALEKFPWGKKDVVNSIRYKYFGKVFADYLIQLKLKQAFGRLIRTNTDKGVFLLLDKAVPSRFLKVFPGSNNIHKLNLTEACKMIKDFLNKQ